MSEELNFKNELETLQNFLKQMSNSNTDEDELLISDEDMYRYSGTVKKFKVSKQNFSDQDYKI
jgi:hypothetical protein